MVNDKYTEDILLNAWLRSGIRLKLPECAQCLKYGADRQVRQNYHMTLSAESCT